MASDNDNTVLHISISPAMSNVAVVVGAASNLGYQVLKKLTNRYHGKIYFTTEDESTGFDIYDSLRENGAKIEYFRVDVTYTKSIINFRHHMQDLDERIDLLINNSEYIIKEKNLSHAEKVRRILSVSFYGYINFGKLIYPLLNENARVVNVSGPAGLLATIENDAIKRRISDPTLTEDELVAILQEYEESVRRGIEKTEASRDLRYLHMSCGLEFTIVLCM